MPVLVTKESKDIKTTMAEILGFFDRQIDPSKGFFLKPNIVFPVPPESGEITRPVVVKGLIEALRKKYGSVDIVMGEGTAAGTDPAENFEVSGYRSLAEELSIPLVDLDQAERVSIPWQYGTIDLPKIALDRVYINLPILKTSAAAIISGAIKNQKGLISPHMKKKFHRMGLHGPLAALTKVVEPDLTILDGYNFFPNDNVLIAGDSVVEIDALAIRLLNSEEPEYFSKLKEEGHVAYEAKIQGVECLDFTTQRRRFEKYKSLMNLRLWSNPRACSMCRLALHQVKGAYSLGFRSSARLYLKVLFYSVTGADLIFGLKPQYEAISERVICIGDCTKSIAKANGYRHVPGCPPTLTQMIDYL
jgi:uncharacterized protein (DUF362 family)